MIRIKKMCNKDQKAITLIALIITIILMLLLAGITISIVIGPQGLLEKASKVTNLYKQEQENEINEIEKLAEKLDTKNDIPTIPIDPDTAQAGDIIKVENNIKYTSDGEGNVIPVPEGFSYAEEGTKETGFVIKNQKDGNEFVWIPVEGMPYTYSRYAFSGNDWKRGQKLGELEENTKSYKITRIDAQNYTFIEENKDGESVEKYGGYYIARYEAGLLSKRHSMEEELTIPIFQKSGDKKIYVYDHVTIEQAKQISEEVYNKQKDNVTSKLCSSYAWDTALQFIETKNAGWSINSVGGNYSGAIKETGQSTPVNNIYDMGGNVYEMTTEDPYLSGLRVVARGGSSASASSWAPAADRSPCTDLSDLGLRIVLFL